MKLADLLSSIESVPVPSGDVAPVLQRRTPHPAHHTVHELIRAQARTTPNAVAITSAEYQMTYAEVDRLSDQLALTLLQHGVRNEEFVLLIMNRSPQIVISMLAVLKAGAAYVPILSTDPLERIEYIARDTSSRIMISEPALRDLAESVRQAMPDQATVLLLDNGRPRPPKPPTHPLRPLYGGRNFSRPRYRPSFVLTPTRPPPHPYPYELPPRL
jgi:non-ribosomal peptide synthetase component F